MTAVMSSFLKCLRGSINGSFNLGLIQSSHRDIKFARYANHFRVRLTSDSRDCVYYKGELQLPNSFVNNEFRNLTFKSPVNSHLFNTKSNASFSPKFSSFGYRNALSFASMNILGHRSYSSSLGGKGSRDGNTEVPAGSSADMSASNDWIDKVKDIWHNAVETATYAGQKVKETSDEMTPHVEQLLESHPYLNNVVIPVAGLVTSTIIAWIVMPRILRKFHKYTMQGPTVLTGSMFGAQVPYEKSFWGALEAPVRYLVTFVAFSQIGFMVAPTTITSQYLVPAWRGALIVSFVWFLHRWKANVFERIYSSQRLLGVDREKMLALDKISSVGLFMTGIMALAEACGVAVQSIVTVGGIGGVATAFAARDILGNVFSGLSMQFSGPFSVGDTIKAGSIEGQVVEMGLTATSLLNAEKFPVIVPNSFFSSQAIVNKSRAVCRAIISKIPLQIADLNKIPQISEDIKNMLQSNAKVFLEREVPYCFLSRIESKCAELTIGYNLKHMRKDELYSAEQEILLQAVQIIQKHGAVLGRTWQDFTIDSDN
ncbi:hypothetical protein L6164_007915 [Bauhinia variegata]|uniref:Uncharacterized protein n=1 Tax=Bauhinia variegata TaxID=167791 RepID=A0ACB9PF75_BAUVA|nr:hypothetical protein L6164_007915 [Bauhinia variegata]